MEKNFAQVIVDVPTQQTNQAYTYRLPEPLRPLAQCGMRVTVPFGRRTVQAIITGLTDQAPATVPVDKLRPVTSLRDLEPVLTSEMLALAAHLAQTTFAFQIAIMQAMLPNALKASYQKIVTQITSTPTTAQATFFGAATRRVLASNEQTTAVLQQLAEWVAAGTVTVTTDVTDRQAVAHETVYDIEQTPTVLTAAKAALRPSAYQQHKLLAYLLAEPASADLRRVVLQKTVGITAATLKTAVQKGWLSERQQVRSRRPVMSEKKPDIPKTLTEEQATAVATIVAAAGYQPFLLAGITGSGKTEVYLQAAAKVVAEGKTVLFLVPEIALTPQMVARVYARFGDRIAVLHSGLSDGERYDEWRRIQAGAADIVVGARSAVFAPLMNLGLIIMDEEHETTYKQHDNPRYHARDVALWRAEYHKIPLVMGSATPALESRARAQKGVYRLLRLTQRAHATAQLPTVRLLDLTSTPLVAPDSSFSEELLTAIRARLARQEQVVLLLNRRGYANFMMCRDCGYVPRDPACQLAMTLHMARQRLQCHYCGYDTPVPQRCPVCQSARLRHYGTGTEKVAAELATLLPDVPVLRMDQDTTRRKGQFAKILAAFEQEEAPILLGTQMIAKGLDFPKVTLVGVLNADTSLGMPDFHASERTFQLLTQVSGRAGRHDRLGEVLIQTYNPEHYALTFAQQQDYEGFYRHEMAFRHQTYAPPYCYTIQLAISDPDPATAAKISHQLCTWLQKKLATCTDVTLLGPTPQLLAKLRGRYYYQIILKYRQVNPVNAVMTELLQHCQRLARTKTQVTIDREPLSLS